MAPFVSKAQMRAAFSGKLGEKMKDKAEEWAKETPDMRSLPERVGETHAQKAKKQLLRGMRGKKR